MASFLLGSPKGCGTWGHRTLMTLLGATGQGPAILTRPVEVVGWAPTDLAPQGVGATLGYYAPSWLHLDHQRRLVCWQRKRRGHSGGRPPTFSTVSDSSAFPKIAVPHPQPCPPVLVSLGLPSLPDLLITPTRGHGPTYSVVGTGPPAHWGSPRNLGHTCREE